MATTQEVLMATDNAAIGERIDTLCLFSRIRTNREIAALLDSPEFPVSEHKVGKWRKGQSLVSGVLARLAYGLAGRGNILNDPDEVLLWLNRGGPEPFQLRLVGTGGEATNDAAAESLKKLSPLRQESLSVTTGAAA